MQFKLKDTFNAVRACLSSVFGKGEKSVAVFWTADESRLTQRKYGEGLVLAGIEPSHPGDLFNRLILEPGRITADEAKLKLGLSDSQFGDFLAGYLSVDDSLAEKLGKMMGSSKQFWLNIQAARDYFEGLKKVGPAAGQPSMQP